MTIERPENYQAFDKNRVAARIQNAVEIRNAADTSAELWLSGEVGWDYDDKSVIQALASLDGEGKSIILNYDSDGGDVFIGYAIGNYIDRMDAKVTVRVGSRIASIATFIASKADSVEMPTNSFYMIHEAAGGAWGRADEIRNTATLIDKVNDQLAATYEAKRLSVLGQVEGAEDFRAMMATGDTWLTAEEAAALGLVDVITDAVVLRACARPDTLDALNAPEHVRAALSAQAEADTSEQDAAALSEAAVAQAAALAAEEAAAVEVAALAVVEAQRAVDIRAACKLMNMSDRADGFIAAKASLDHVRTALFKARAESDQKTAVDTRKEPTGTPAARALSPQERVAQAADKQREALRAIANKATEL
jgi:ATP-dependent protease ClpP protease subunit